MSLLLVEEERQNKSTMETQVQEGVTATATSIAAVATKTDIARTIDYVSMTENISAMVTNVLATPLNSLSNNINIIKGKRIKRQRPQSPLSFTLAPTNSSSNNRGGDGVNGTSTSNEYSGIPTITEEEEEEEIAKCLLLLSQGNPNSYNSFGTVPYKFCSKRYIETNTTTNGKYGMYVYQCKTCDRTFPSFQALGGHRASHWKSKNIVTTTTADENYKPIIFSDEEEDHNQQQQPFKRRFSASSLSLQLSTRVMSPNTFNNVDHNKSSPKIHECAICGTEFTSGQALGGHMRRHRGFPLNKSTTIDNTKILSPIMFSPNPISAIDPTDYQHEAKKVRSENINLSLKLNLHATVENNNNKNNNNLELHAYSLTSYQQPKEQQHQHKKQSPLVLSTTPTLVDCQY